MSNEPPSIKRPVEIIRDRLVARDESKGWESQVQSSYAIIGALEQNGWMIVRKRHMRLPK